MAELVNKHVESMLPELQEYQQNNIFSSDEIRLILKKRSMFEYRCQRRIVKKSDFLRYIQFELYVDQLRATRCKIRRITGAQATQNYAIVQRIHRLFRSALLKFKGDLKLWLQYIKFCKTQKSSKKLQQAVQDALKYHQYCEGLWILAAQFDFEHDNVDGARLSLMAALRALPESKKVWLEYFRMELMHVDKLRKRYVATITSTKKKARLSNEAEKVLEGDQFSCKVADRVYNAAIQRVDEVAFHQSFLEIYRNFEFCEQSCEGIYATLAEKHADDALASNILCLRPLAGAGTWSGPVRAEREQQCDKLFQDATEAMPTAEMREHYCQFWLSAVEHHQLKGNVNALENAVLNVLCVCQQALDKACLSLQTASKWIDLLMLAGHVTDAVRITEHILCAHADNPDIWMRRLELEICLGRDGVEALYQRCKKSLPAAQLGSIAHLYARRSQI